MSLEINRAVLCHWWCRTVPKLVNANSAGINDPEREIRLAQKLRLLRALTPTACRDSPSAGGCAPLAQRCAMSAVYPEASRVPGRPDAIPIRSPARCWRKPERQDF